MGNRTKAFQVEVKTDKFDWVNIPVFTGSDKLYKYRLEMFQHDFRVNLRHSMLFEIRPDGDNLNLFAEWKNFGANNAIEGIASGIEENDRFHIATFSNTGKMMTLVHEGTIENLEY